MSASSPEFFFFAQQCYNCSAVRSFMYFLMFNVDFQLRFNLMIAIDYMTLYFSHYLKSVLLEN